MGMNISQPLLYDGTMFARPCDGARNIPIAPEPIPVGADGTLNIRLILATTFRPVDLAFLSGVDFWRFCVAEDFDRNRAMLYATTEVTVDSASNALSVALNGSYTPEMQTALGLRPKGVFSAELAGFAAQGDDSPVWCLSFPVCFANRRDDGTPTTPLAPGRFVMYAAQTLTEAEKAQARANIGALGEGDGGEENVIETVKVNGTALVPDAQKAVNVTKEGLGLGNVDNTSDMNKPISTAMQTALDGKMDVLSGASVNTIPTVWNRSTGQLKPTNVVARTDNGFDRIELHGTGLPNEFFGMDINGPFLKANDDNQARVAIPTPSNSDTIALESKTMPKVLSPTPGNAVKLDSSGHVVDSGIAMPVSPSGVEVALLRDIDVGTAAARDVPSSGNATSYQVVLGSDTRLNDARTPTAHTHEISDVTGLQVALDGKADDSDIVLECRTAYSAWTPIRELTDEEKELFYAEDQSSAQNDYAITVEDTTTGEAGTWKVYVGGYQCGVGNTVDSALTLECVSGTPAFLFVFSYIPSTDPDHHKIATRTQATLPGYVLGRQTGKPLADADDVAAKADDLFTVASLPSSVPATASRIYTVSAMTASQAVAVALPSLSDGTALTVELALVVASGASVGSVTFTVNGASQTATWLDEPTWTAGKTSGLAVRLMNIGGTYTLLANKYGEW